MSKRSLEFTNIIPVNCPITSPIMGKTKKTARCCDSSMVCDLAEPSTVMLIETREIEGARSSITTSQFISGRITPPVNSSISIPTTIIIAINEMKETIIPTAKAANILA